MTKIFCIDGNIGAGKTTILNELKNLGYCVYEEELSEWGELLNRFYSNQKRWMFTLQVAILHSMHQQYKKLIQTPTFDPCARSALGCSAAPLAKPVGAGRALRSKVGGPDDVVFIERSPQSSMLFVKNGVRQGFIDEEEENVIKNLYNDLYWKPDKVFYLNTDVDLCYDRMKLRGRECEKSVTKDYLQFIHAEYQQLYNNQNAFILQNTQNIQVLSDQILNFI